MASTVGSAPGRLDLLGGVADYGRARARGCHPAHDHGGRGARRHFRCGTGGADRRRDGGARAASVSGDACRPRIPTALDALRGRCRAGAGAPRRRRTAASPPLRVVRRAPLRRGVVERRAGDRDGTGARRRRRRPDSTRVDLPGGGEPRGRCALRDHGPGRRRDGPRRRGAPDPLSTRVGTTAGAPARRHRGGRATDGRGARRRWGALRQGPRCGVHGQAHPRGSKWSDVAVGQRAARGVHSTTSRRRSRARPSSTTGARPTTTSPRSIPRRPTRSWPRRDSASRNTDGVRPPSSRSAAVTPPRSGPLMAASHAGYDAMGLGHPAATVTVAALLERPGVHGARSSAGGSGGTVVTVCERAARSTISPT